MLLFNPLRSTSYMIFIDDYNKLISVGLSKQFYWSQILWYISICITTLFPIDFTPLNSHLVFFSRKNIIHPETWRSKWIWTNERMFVYFTLCPICMCIQLYRIQHALSLQQLVVFLLANSVPWKFILKKMYSLRSSLHVHTHTHSMVYFIYAIWYMWTADTTFTVHPTKSRSWTNNRLSGILCGGKIRRHGMMAAN